MIVFLFYTFAVVSGMSLVSLVSGEVAHYVCHHGHTVDFREILNDLQFDPSNRIHVSH